MENTCYHCGDHVVGAPLILEDKMFCCNGCQMVYRILKNNDLEGFYKFESVPGTKPSNLTEGKYNFLEIPEIRQKHILFEENGLAKVLLYLPSIHCSSCIYLLENLTKINENIRECLVNFTAREAAITFNSENFKLSELATLLHEIGYAPNFGNRKKAQKLIDKTFLIKLGIAGFAFGSIMLWSFPEYLGIDEVDPDVRQFMAFLSFVVSIPVLLYSGNEFIISAWKAVKAKSVNLDVPITLGIFALYFQSCYAIFNGQGAGYMDSFAGFIFFLLIGKWFQSKTYQALSFERDYTSYFPIAVTRQIDNRQETIAIEQLQKGDVILIHNEEIIPCDSELISADVTMDYSFVTGESELIVKQAGDHIYAGGKIIGKSAQLKVLEATNRSHLTSLWNNSSTKPITSLFDDAISKWFLLAVIAISVLAGSAWLLVDSSKMIEVIVAILIVACPCALALSSPFTYGNSMRKLGRYGLYLKHVSVVKDMEGITDIVFDKTGTLTEVDEAIEYQGETLSSNEERIIGAMVHSSTHPYVMALKRQMKRDGDILELLGLEQFKEWKGKGMVASVNGVEVKMGSASYLDVKQIDEKSAIYIMVDGVLKGRFVFKSVLRQGLKGMVEDLKGYQLHVLSGDNEKDWRLLRDVFPKDAKIAFRQTPQSKKEYIEQLKSSGASVLMVGDGLNDTGALKAADVGISITEDVFQFTPSSDAILDASKMRDLAGLLRIAKFSKKILRVCFGFSLLYNTIGLSFAISGKLQPIVAAIIMPLSSITIVATATIGVMWFAPKIRKK